MKEIEEKAAMLLVRLDNEINIKCQELKEKQREAKLKKIFFSGCLFILFSFLIQVFFKIFNVNLIITFFTYQGVALILVAPLILNLNRGELSK
jgi:hypothetical protein